MELVIFMIAAAGIAWFVVRRKPVRSTGDGSAQQGPDETPVVSAEVEAKSSGKEFLIRSDDGEWYTYPEGSGGEVFHPREHAFTVVEGTLGGYAIEINGCTVEFSNEMVGIQVIMRSDCTMDDPAALALVIDIMRTVESVTGQPSQVLQVGGWDTGNEPEWADRPIGPL